MKVVEKFISINGEGKKAGQLAVFIRFKHCNLECAYCDTKWANEQEAIYEEMSEQDIAEYIQSTGIKNVTLTGGEPLIQDNIMDLFALLTQYNVRIEIETNGSIDLSQYIYTKQYNGNKIDFTMDYKLPCSNMEEKMFINNLNIVRKNDVIKFVAGSIQDLDKMKELIEEYDLLNRTNVYVSSVFGKLDAADIVAYMIKNKMNDVHLQLQLHKYIWHVNQRGV